MLQYHRSGYIPLSRFSRLNNNFLSVLKESIFGIMKLTTLLYTSVLTLSTRIVAENCKTGIDYCGWDLVNTGGDLTFYNLKCYKLY